MVEAELWRTNWTPFHEPYEFRIRAPIESGGGPPHSKTLARWPQSRAPPPGFGVRRPCGALDCPDRFMVPMHAKKRKGALQENRPFVPIIPLGTSTHNLPLRRLFCRALPSLT